MKIISLSATAALLLGVAACNQGGVVPATDASATAAPAMAAKASANVYPFKIGTLEATALLDGANPVANDNQTFGLGQTPAAVGAVLSASGRPTDKIALSIHPLLVRTGGKLVLLDTGLGPVAGGKLMASLSEAGVDPASITDILISHGHADHIGGLVDANGALAFPNATVHLSAVEWKAIQANDAVAAISHAIAPKVQTFETGAQVAPGITAEVLAGHTPGHSIYEITSGTDKLLYTGDTYHSDIISVQKPEWPMGYDGDKAEAIRQRQALLARLGTSGERVFAVHFPFPGLGKVQKSGEGFVWVAEPKDQRE